VIVYAGSEARTLHVNPEIRGIQAVICRSTKAHRAAKAVATTIVGVIATLVIGRTLLAAVVFVCARESSSTSQCLPQRLRVWRSARSVDRLIWGADTAGSGIATFSAPERLLGGNAISIAIAATSRVATTAIIRDAHSVVRAPLQHAGIHNAPDFVGPVWTPHPSNEHRKACQQQTQAHGPQAVFGR